MTSISSYSEKKNLRDCIIKNLYRNIIYSHVEKKDHAHKEQILKFSLSTWNLNQELLAIIPAFALIWDPSCPQELALGMSLEWIAGFWDRGQAMVKDFPFWKQPISMLDISYCDTASLFIKSTKLALKSFWNRPDHSWVRHRVIASVQEETWDAIGFLKEETEWKHDSVKQIKENYSTLQWY